MLNYLILSSLGIGISYFLYIFLLKQEKTFVFNRFFLLIGLVLALIAPTLKIENSMVSPVVGELSSTSFIQEAISIDEHTTSLRIEKTDSLAYSTLPYFLFIYFFITAIMLLRFARNLIRLKRLSVHRGPIISGLQIVYLEKKTAPFSFFHYVFVNQKDYYSNMVSKSLLNHELAHSRQLHSFDILLIELVMCCFWFNPFIWLYRKSMAANHEFIADQYAVGRGLNLRTYAKNIIQSAGNYNSQSLTSGFSFIQTKNRITMLNRQKSSFATRVLKLAIVIPLVSASFILTSCVSDIPIKPFTVIIDAGHGGEDAGAKFENILEKDIVLEVAKRVNELGIDSDITLVLSRDTDDFIDLLSRTEFADGQKADLLLSLHVNSANESKMNGIEVYYSKKGKFQDQSFSYSEILISEQLRSNFSNGEIKSAPFWVLEKSNVPSVLIELGFLSNDLDRKKLQDPEYLDQLALSIYTGLEKIKDQSTN